MDNTKSLFARPIPSRYVVYVRREISVEGGIARIGGTVGTRSVNDHAVEKQCTAGKDAEATVFGCRVGQRDTEDDGPWRIDRPVGGNLVQSVDGPKKRGFQHERAAKKQKVGSKHFSTAGRKFIVVQNVLDD